MMHLDIDRIPGLAMLPADDPDRVDAEAHAAGCEACTSQLRAAANTLRQLDAMPAPTPPGEAVLARIEMQVLLRMANPSPTARTLAMLAGAVAFGGLVFTISPKALVSAPTQWMEAALVAAFGVVAAILGARSETSRGGILAALGSMSVSLLFSGLMGEGTALAPMLGAKCLSLELVAAVVPLGAAALLMRRGAFMPSAGRLASLAAGAALVASAAFHLVCHVHGTPHLFLFHAGGVFLAAMMGAGFARARFLTASAR